MEMNQTVAYLKSLLLPETGPSSIPDDVLERHILKTETSTYNLAVPASGSGLVVFFPGYPGTRVGSHYKWDSSASKYVFDQWITTAQHLGVAFNFCRVTSRIMILRSSTLPSGVYALNGTINAVTFEGSLSEITDLTYNGLMSSTANVQDKVANTLVGDGVAVTMLPTSYDKPYVRLGDALPMDDGSAAGSSAICSSSINPRRYDLSLPPSTTILKVVKSTPALILGANVDIMTATTMALIAKVKFQGTAEDTVTLKVKLFGLDQADTDTPVYQVTSTGKITSSVRDVVFNINANIPAEKITQPVTRCTVTMECSGTTAHTFFSQPSQIPVLTLQSGIGNYPGALRPVTLCAYEKMSPNSILTLSGTSNFEVIPNPELAKNMSTQYGRYSPEELNYVKMILANRDRLDIRTVWPLKEYRARQASLLELSDLGSSLPIAKTWGWKDLVNTIRKIAAPVLSSFFPMLAPAISTASDAIGEAIGKTAGGRYGTIGRTAGGVYRTGRAPRALAWGFPRGASATNQQTSPYTRAEPDSHWTDATNGVLLPTVVVTQHAPINAFGQICLLTPGDRTRDLPPASQGTFTPFAGGSGGIYGFLDPSGIEWTSNQTYTLIPIDDVDLKNSRAKTSRLPIPPSEGPSVLLGLAVLERGTKPGIPPYVFTGEVGPDKDSIIPVLGTEWKSSAAHRLGLPLVGINPTADIVVTTVQQAASLPRNPPRRAPAPGPGPPATLGAQCRGLCAGADGFVMSQAVRDKIRELQEIADEEENLELYNLLNVIFWVDDTGLTPLLERWSDVDPDGDKLARVLENPPNPNSKTQRRGTGPTQEENQLAKAERLAETEQSRGFSFATTQWIRENGYTGPSAGQVKYWLIEHQTPTPGDHYTDYVTRSVPKKPDPTRVQKIADNIYGNPNQAPAPPEFTEMVEQIFLDNGGRGPDNEQMQDLRDAARQMKRTRPSPVEARRKHAPAPRAQAPARRSRFRQLDDGGLD